MSLFCLRTTKLDQYSANRNGLNIRQKLATAILVLAFTVVLCLVYWEFNFDISAENELQFFASIEPVPDSQNALFSLAAVKAPLNTRDLREWGARELGYAGPGSRTGTSKRQEKVETQVSNPKIEIVLRDESGHLNCWLPGYDWEGKRKNCLDKATLREVLQLNRVAIQRYRQAFEYPSLYYELRDHLGIREIINLTKLITVDYWMRRDSLDDKDIGAIFDMMRFWERVILQGNHGAVGMAFSLVNYGMASSLITHLSELNPNILIRYYENYGKFHDDPVNAMQFENLVKHEFRMLNAEYCFITHYGERPADCQTKDYAFTFKPGRTIRILYEKRLQYQDCVGPQQRMHNIDGDNELLIWLKAIARPGNLRGRWVALVLLDGQKKTCEIFENLRYKLETNRFRNFYIDLVTRGILADELDILYREDREFFKIGDSDEYYEWDTENDTLVFNLPGFEIDYTLPL